MKYSILLFDIDGTLLDFLRAEDEALRETMTEFNITPDKEKVSTYSKINESLWKALERGEIEKSVLLYKRFELFCEHFGFLCDHRKMAESYTSNLSHKGYFLDGAKELCEKLHKCGKFKMYIVTNGVEFIQKGRYKASGITQYFDGNFISGVVGYEKPSEKYFEYVAEHIPNFDKSSAIIIGDSLTSDIKGGINFGIDTCWYNPLHKQAPEKMNITYNTDSFDEIYQILTSESEN